MTVTSTLSSRISTAKSGLATSAGPVMGEEVQSTLSQVEQTQTNCRFSSEGIVFTGMTANKMTTRRIHCKWKILIHMAKDGSFKFP